MEQAWVNFKKKFWKKKLNEKTGKMDIEERHKVPQSSLGPMFSISWESLPSFSKDYYELVKSKSLTGNGNPILYVEEGDWQRFDDEGFEELHTLNACWPSLKGLLERRFGGNGYANLSWSILQAFLIMMVLSL
ncbi:MAG: hypothetical protein KJ718_05490 [Nanoarchaeota archaeon]|nr:hypothetical protein [Nanoarchaeota archaeon]